MCIVVVVEVGAVHSLSVSAGELLAALSTSWLCCAALTPTNAQALRYPQSHTSLSPQAAFFYTHTHTPADARMQLSDDNLHFHTHASYSIHGMHLDWWNTCACAFTLKIYKHTDTHIPSCTPPYVRRCQRCQTKK